MNKNTFFTKKGKRYYAIDEYQYGFRGLPADGLLYKYDNGLTCFLQPKNYDVNLDIQKLSYLQVKTMDVVLGIRDEGLSVYNKAPYDFVFEVIKRISMKSNK